MVRKTRLSGWGRCPTQLCSVAVPRSVSQLREAVSRHEPHTYIARGLGRSYGDSSLNQEGSVLVQTRLKRFLDFDDERGVLECEAGVALAEIIEHLLPRGWFLPTTPGTKHVTVGGAIAADVHGKNHHVDGSFGNFVLSLRLLLASGEILECSPEDNATEFWATVGGMGLTGVILTAKLQLLRVDSAFFDLTLRRTANLDATLELLRDTESEYRHSVAWMDGLATGALSGRSVVMLANHADPDELPETVQEAPFRVRGRRIYTVPFDLPSGTVRPWTVRGFNALYFARHREERTVVDYETLFYPLDSLRAWNRIYGKRGFVQYQALFPHRSARRGLVEVLQAVADSPLAPYLAVLKTSGEPNEGMLSYLYPGVTLALDLPNSAGLRGLCRRLDKILLSHGGRLYLAKDALATAETFGSMYPSLGRFREIKKRLDPECRFVSSQARRLGIVSDE